MDSRVLPEIMFNLGVGDAEVIRVASHMLAASRRAVQKRDQCFVRADHTKRWRESHHGCYQARTSARRAAEIVRMTAACCSYCCKLQFICRSLTVAQEIVPPGSRTIFVIHHTDCGKLLLRRLKTEYMSIRITQAILL